LRGSVPRYCRRRRTEPGCPAGSGTSRSPTGSARRCPASRTRPS
jgi:hypothetical protein